MDNTSELPATYVPGFHDEADVKRMTYRRLGHTDMNVSEIGFGGSDFGSVYLNTNKESCFAALERAIKRGVNYVDTAPLYGNSEQRLGEALEKLPRGSYYVATKVGHYQTPEGEDYFDFSHDGIMQSIDRSLQRLRLDYVDLIQLHDYEYARDLDLIINESLPALQKIRESGKARYIGINGYPMTIYRDVLERSPVRIDTILSYNHCTMLDNSLCDHLQYFKEKEVGVINASPFASGFLINRDLPSWHPGRSPEIQPITEACRQAIIHCKDNGTDIAKLAMHKTLELCRDSGIIATTLVGMNSVAQVDANVSALYQRLTEVEAKLSNDVLKRFFDPLESRDWNVITLRKFQNLYPDVTQCWWWPKQN